MPRLRASFRRIHAKITAYYLLAFSVVLIVIVLTMNALYRDRLSEEVSLVVGQRLSLAGSKLDAAMAEIRQLHFSLIRSPILQASMRTHPAAASADNLEHVLAMKNEITRMTGRYASVRSAILISSSGEILDPIYQAQPYRDMLLRQGDYQRFVQSHFVSWFSAPGTFPLSNEGADEAHKNTVTYLGAFYDEDSYQMLGSVAINLTRHSLLGEAESILKSAFSAAFIVDKDGRQVLHIGEPLALPVGPVEGTVHIGGLSYAGYSVPLAAYPLWRMVGLVSLESIDAPARSLTWTLMLVAAFALFALYWIGYSISRRITMPLRELKGAMPELGKGNWRELSVASSSEEIDELVDGFNGMARSLRSLTAQIELEQGEKQRIQVQMIQSQLDLLQSQINPHFIHNTLNTMRYMAQKEGCQELASLIVSFNSLLRASMSQTNMLCPFQEELENLHHYMRIQRHRYDVDLTFTIDADDGSLSVQLPKLLLQPLVENALFHGILPVGQGEIRVVARVASARLWITVADNGAGMSRERLTQLLSGTLPNARGYNQVGLKNVDERLRIFFGPTSHLVIDSQDGQGTEIGFSIPC